MSGEHLDKLLADLKARAARQALKGQLVRGWEWTRRPDGELERIETRHLLIGTRLVALTLEQIAELEADGG